MYDDDNIFDALVGPTPPPVPPTDTPREPNQPITGGFRVRGGQPLVPAVPPPPAAPAPAPVPTRDPAPAPTPTPAPEQVQPKVETRGYAARTRVETSPAHMPSSWTRLMIVVAVCVGVAVAIMLVGGRIDAAIQADRVATFQNTPDATASGGMAGPGTWSDMTARNTNPVTPTVDWRDSCLQVYHSPNLDDKGACITISKTQTVTATNVYDVQAGAWLLVLLPDGTSKWVQSNAVGLTTDAERQAFIKEHDLGKADLKEPFPTSTARRGAPQAPPPVPQTAYQPAPAPVRPAPVQQAPPPAPAPPAPTATPDTRSDARPCGDAPEFNAEVFIKSPVNGRQIRIPWRSCESQEDAQAGANAQAARTYASLLESARQLQKP